MKEISIARGKEKLAATLHIPQVHKPPVIVMCHGFASSKDSETRIKAAEKLCENGFAVLRFDFYGHGKSSGKFECFTISEGIKDLKAVLDWVSEQKCLDEKKIGVHGSSLGGTIAILTASLDSRIKALVTLAAPIRFSELLTGEMIESFEKKGFYELRPGLRIRKRLYEDMKCHIVAKALKELTIPLLIIHGKEDEIVHYGNALDIYKFANGPKRLELIEKAGHDLKAIPAVLNLTLDWFRQWLKS